MSMRWLLSVLAVALLAPVCPADLPPVIPRAILFGNPEKVSPQISPDGKMLAYIAPDDRDVLQVWVRPINENEPRKVTADKKRGIRSFFWTYEPSTLVYSQDAEGDENFHLMAVNIHNATVRDLTPFQGTRAMFVSAEAKFPGEILVALNVRNKAKFDVYRVNLKNGAVDFEADNPGNIVGWLADSAFKIRAAVAATPDGGTDLLVRDNSKAAWRKILHWNSEETGSPLQFSKDGGTLYLQANHDGNTLRLIALDLKSGKEKVLAEDAEYDLAGVIFHPTTRVVEAVGFLRDKITWKAHTDEMKNALAELSKLRPGQISIPSRDEANKTWIVAYSNANGPTFYVKYDREQGAKTAEVLFSHQPKLEKLDLAPMKSVSYKARDGLTIHGYLTTPVGVPEKNLPTVLLVHGGPWARDVWGYSPMVQWLANRGYAVLQVNFRGSTGYGKKFLNAGNKEWAGKMHDDLIDGVNWLVKDGVADPSKIAIMGGSYGGYATLVGLTFTPDVFACGVDIVGPSNIITLLKTVPPYWAPMLAMFQKRVGNLKEEEEFLKSRSPLFFVDRIKAPLLIGQGANDPRVKQAESDQIAAALRKAGKQVEYILYTDEGHGFARPENRMHFYAHAEGFLSRYLGGRAEAIGEVKGHSGEIR